MKKMLTACVAVMAVMAASNAYARGPLFQLVKSPFRLAQNPLEPAPVLTPSPMPEATYGQPGAEPVPVEGAAIPLYHCVRYKDERNIAPCAVPMVVMVKDPCATCDPCNPCAAPQCVAVQICVPPCSECPPRVTCRRGGEYVKYDFGKYAVKITSRKGVVTVNYDD